MKILKYICLISSLLVIVGCSNSQIKMEIKDGEYIEFCNSGINLLFDSEMYSTVYYKKDNKLRSLISDELRGKESMPSFLVVVNNDTINNFEIDFNNVEIEDINNVFGKGKRLLIKGQANELNKIEISIKMFVELYYNFPNTAITYAEFINNSKKEIVELKSVISNYYELDASVVNSELQPNSFYSFYGTAADLWHKLKQQFLMILTQKILLVGRIL